jgi:hypothetical protein
MSMFVNSLNSKRKLEGVRDRGNGIYGPIWIAIKPSRNFVLRRSNRFCEGNKRKAALLSV